MEWNICIGRQCAGGIITSSQKNAWMLTASGKAWTHWKGLCESVSGCDRKALLGAVERVCCRECNEYGGSRQRASLGKQRLCQQSGRPSAQSQLRQFAFSGFGYEGLLR